MTRTVLLLSMLAGWFANTAQITWSPAVSIASSSFGNYFPRIVTDGSGNPLVTWGRSDGALYLARWSGSGFQQPAKLNPSWMKVASAWWMGPDLAARGDTVYVVMKRTPETADTNHVYLVSSFNGGQTFAAPSRVSFIGDSLSRFATVAVGPGGQPLVAFMKFDSNFSGAHWVVSRSTDFGQTYLADVNASGWSGTAAEACDCCPGALVTSGSKLAMLYRDNLSNERDIWAGYSSNGGAGFSTGLAVDNRNWMYNTCPSSGPDGVIAGDTLYSVFMSGGGTTGFRTYLSKTSLGTLSLAAVSPLTGTVSGLSQQNYPRMDRSGNAAAIVWRQTVNSKAELALKYTDDLTSGFSLGYELVDMDDVTNTDVALYGDRIHVVWQDDKSGNVMYRTGVYTKNITGAGIKSVDHLFVYPNPSAGLITIYSAAGKDDVAEFFDLFGKKCLHVPLELGANRVDLSSLERGVYILRAGSPAGQVIKLIRN
jgi:hypothetical protein